MNSITSLQQALLNSSGEVFSSFFLIIPKLLGAIIIFAVGLIIAYWIKRLVVESLKLVKFEKLSEVLGVEKYLKKADFKLSLTELTGSIVEWIIILIFFLAVLNTLGLEVVSQVLIGVLAYIPNIVAAVLIFAAGYLLAGVVDGLVRGALASVDHKVAKPLGQFSKWLVLAIAFFAAVDELKVAQGLISVFYQGLTYTIVLAVGLSVGLGAKDLVSRVLNDWYEKIRK